MQKKLVSVASEVEKLRAEVANAEKRSRAAVSAGNQGLFLHYIAFVPDSSCATYLDCSGLRGSKIS